MTADRFSERENGAGRSADELGPSVDDGRGTAVGSDSTALAARVAALERAVSDDEHGATEDDSDGDASIEELRERLDALEDRLVEVESAAMALRGYVGAVRAVNERVERRAERALALARDGEGALGGGPPADADLLAAADDGGNTGSTDVPETVTTDGEGEGRVGASWGPLGRLAERLAGE